MTIPNITIQNEYIRKAIHIGFTSSIVMISFLAKTEAILLLAMTTILMLVYENVRKNTKFRQILKNLKLIDILRQHENTSLTGASYVILATLICYFLFSKDIFILSMLTLGWADSAAALIGRKFGNSESKSLIGSCAFLLTCYILILSYAYFFNLQKLIIAGLISGLVATITERYSIKIGLDDNLSVPVSFALSMQILTSFHSIYPVV